MAFPSGWNNKQKIAIDYTKVSGSSDLINQPILLTEANFALDVFTHTQGKEIYTNHLYLDANLQGYWRLENNLNDSSANGYNLTAFNSPTYTTGNFGSGLDLELSSSQYALITSASSANLRISGSQTWCGWVKAESLHTGRVMALADGTYTRALYLGSDGKVYFYIDGLSTFITSDISYVVGEWVFVCGVWDSSAGKLKVWINGVKKELSSVTGTPISLTSDFAIGRNGSVNNTFFDGVLDDLAVYSRALSDAEIVGLFRGGQDLRFTSDEAGTTEIAFEVVNWDIVNQKAEVWTKIPTLSYTTNTIIYTWYSNSTASPYAYSDTYGSDNAQYSSHKIALNFGDGANDSTSNRATPTVVNGPVYTTGKFGKAIDLEATSSQYITFPDSSPLDLTGNIAVGAWVNFESTPVSGDGMVIASKYFDTGNQRSYSFLLYNDGGTLKLRFAYSSDGTFQAGNVAMVAWTPSTGTWYKIEAHFDAASAQVRFYVNGSQQGVTQSCSNTSVYNSTALLYIGALQFSSGNTWFFDGKIERLTVSTSKTAALITTEYNNENSPSSFASEVLVKSFLETIVLVESFTRSATFLRTVTEVVILSETLLRNITKTFTEIFSVTDLFLKAFLLTIVETVTVTASIVRTYNASRILTEVFSVNEVFSKSLTLDRVFVEAITILDISIKRILNGLLVPWVKKAKDVAGDWTEKTKDTVGNWASSSKSYD